MKQQLCPTPQNTVINSDLVRMVRKGRKERKATFWCPSSHHNGHTHLPSRGPKLLQSAWNHWADENAWGGLGLKLTISQLQGLEGQSLTIHLQFPFSLHTPVPMKHRASYTLPTQRFPIHPWAARQGGGWQQLERHKEPLECICASAQTQLHVRFVGAFQTTKGFCWFKVNIILISWQCWQDHRKGAGLEAVWESNFIYWKALFLLITL